MNWLNKFAIALGLANGSLGHAALPQMSNLHNQKAENTADIIHHSLKEANELYFPDQMIRVELLKNYPEMIPILVEWVYEDWHPYDASLTKQMLKESFQRRCNEDKLPFTLVALSGSTPIGIVSLKERPEPELSDLWDGDPWGGSLHIISEARNQGIGENLAKTLVMIAKRLEYKKILFYTSNLHSVPWYTQQGAEILETRTFRNHTITVMRYML